MIRCLYTAQSSESQNDSDLQNWRSSLVVDGNKK